MNKTIIYYNGIFHTMEPTQPPASAVACRDGKFVGVVNLDDFGCMTSAAELVDLEGRFVFPGFIDCYSAPGITAFTEAAASAEDFYASDISQWTKDLLEVFRDKGVATVCLHGPAALDLTDEAQRFLTDVKYETDFEKDLNDGYYDYILDSPQTSGLLFAPVYDDSQSVQEAVDKLTWLAATNIGMETQLGTIKPGKMADLTIFDNDPLLTDLKTFSRMHVSMTVIGGEVAYDSSEQAMTELYDLLTSQAF